MSGAGPASLGHYGRRGRDASSGRGRSSSSCARRLAVARDTPALVTYPISSDHIPVASLPCTSSPPISSLHHVPPSRPFITSLISIRCISLSQSPNAPQTCRSALGRCFPSRCPITSLIPPSRPSSLHRIPHPSITSLTPPSRPSSLPHVPHSPVPAPSATAPAGRPTSRRACTPGPAAAGGDGGGGREGKKRVLAGGGRRGARGGRVPTRPARSRGVRRTDG